MIAVRLKVTHAAAEERLTLLVNEGYNCLYSMETDYGARSSAGQFKPELEIPRYNQAFDDWVDRVHWGLQELFPSELEWNYFRTQEIMKHVHYLGINQGYAELQESIKPFIARLQDILTSHLGRYTDLPLDERLYVECVDSFVKVRDVNPSMVAAFLKDGYLDVAEDTVQLALEAILDVPFHKKDWGGELNDLYTANVVLHGCRRPTAFLLKGNGLNAGVMEIKHCGKNGDQIVRLFQSPADLFMIQFVGTISEFVIQHARAEIARLKTQGKDSHFLIMDGQDTARLMHAYGKL
jgi:hypothetical protein